MDYLDKLKEAQKEAPSYLRILPDGAPIKCNECGKEGTEGFVKTFTPDGKTHYASHITCLDEDWFNEAKDMGTI